jgi:hypothetical protein
LAATSLGAESELLRGLPLPVAGRFTVAAALFAAGFLAGPGALRVLFLGLLVVVAVLFLFLVCEVVLLPLADFFGVAAFDGFFALVVVFFPAFDSFFFPMELPRVPCVNCPIKNGQKV